MAEIDFAAAAANGFILDRRTAVPALIGRHQDFLFVTGLAGTARDIAALTQDGTHIYTMAGAMGGAVMIGLGLALARPDKRVLAVTGDGELLMNVGALATVAILNPANFAVLCVDNGHYGETGYQKSHTSLGVDLEKMAAGAGIERTRTVGAESELAEGARMLRDGNGTAFVVLKVTPTDPPAYKRNFDLAACRERPRPGLDGSLHHRQRSLGNLGRRMVRAVHRAAQLDDLVLQRVGAFLVSRLPQHRGKVAHRDQRVRVLVAEDPAGSPDRFLQQALGLRQIARHRQGSRQIVDRAKGFPVLVAP